MGHCPHIRSEDDDSTDIDTDQVCGLEEQALCPSLHTVTGGHLVTSVHITHMDIVVFNGQRFCSTARFMFEIFFCRWGMNFGQYIHLSFVLQTHSLQVPS
jgi:hypothetical protein